MVNKRKGVEPAKLIGAPMRKGSRQRRRMTSFFSSKSMNASLRLNLMGHVLQLSTIAPPTLIELRMKSHSAVFTTIMLMDGGSMQCRGTTHLPSSHLRRMTLSCSIRQERQSQLVRPGHYTAICRGRCFTTSIRFRLEVL